MRIEGKGEMAEQLHSASSNGHVRDLTPEEGREAFDKAALYYLDISGDEFIRRWNEGYYNDDPDDPDVVEVIMMLPLVR